MKRFTICLLSFVMVFSLVSTAYASGYTLPEKMSRQLQVGSGLKGSFVIHGNADAERNPFVHAIQNAEYELRGIQSEGNLHYYVYQNGINEERNALTEFYRKDGRLYLQSSYLDSKAYLLPDLNYFTGHFLNAEGENTPVLVELLKLLIDPRMNENMKINTDQIERQIEIWLSGFSSETTIIASDKNSPTLSQSFSIPVDSLFNMITEVIRYLTQNDSAMTLLSSVLNEEQIALYFNPNLLYYYQEALRQLDLKGNIEFSRTVSTLGESISSSIVLPLDETKTGYSSLTIQNDEKNKSFLISGEKGILYLEMPMSFDRSQKEYDQEFSVIHIRNGEKPEKNVSLRIRIVRNHEEKDDAEESKTHETDHYSVHAETDTSILPELVSADQVYQAEPFNAELELHYSSKLQLSSATTLEFSASVIQGNYSVDVTGMVKTTSPWEFSPFDIADAVNTGEYTIDELRNLKSEWISAAEKNLDHTPEDIQPTDDSETLSSQSGE